MKLKRQYNQQPNIITNTSEELSLLEKRIVYLVINQIKTEKDINLDLFHNEEYIIETSKISETNTVRVQQACKRLANRTYTMVEDFKNGIFHYMTPFPSIKFNKNQGTIKLVLFAEAVPVFKEIKKGYTTYELAAALTLSSVYSQKMYELLSRWKDKKEWAVSLLELQTLMSATTYKYAQFKQKCLNVAVVEINEKTDLSVKWETEKAGKAVVKIIFFISNKVSTDLQEAKEAVNKEMNQLHNLSAGEIALYMNRLINDYSFSSKQRDLIISSPGLMGKFAELESKVANGVIKNIKNPTAYIASILFKQK
jgi:plasmid replication initiation protein